MMLHLVGCWAIAAALAQADDKPKADEVKKPTTAAEALVEMNRAKTTRPRMIEDILANQDKVIAAADAVLGFKDASDEQKDQALVAKVMALYTKSRRKPAAVKDFDEFVKVVEKDYPKSAAMGTIATMNFAKKHMSQRIEKVDPAVVAELLELAKKYPKETAFGNFYASMARVVESSDGAKEAVKFLEGGVKAFPNNAQLAGALMNLKIIGQPMEIVGPTLEGSEFNVASLKGRVVFVDFWATWCPPCVGEIPHVKEAYEKHHKKGFEVVAISLDRSREPLEKFVKEKELPWTQIFFATPDGKADRNPLADKYGVNAIPATYLIGRDGKVVARNLRGDKLGPAIEKELAKTSPTAN